MTGDRELPLPTIEQIANYNYDSCPGVEDLDIAAALARAIQDLEAQARSPQTEYLHRQCNRLYNEAKDQYDAAIARAEAAEAQVEAQHTEYRLMHDSQDHWRRIALNLEQERDAERERAGRLALYAKHQYGCGVDTKGGMFAPGPCTCGLSAALALPASDTKEDGDE